MPSEKFANRFNAALDMRNINAADLARTTGIPESALSSYKSGKYEPKQRRLDLISKALNVSVPWLMGYDVPIETEKLPTLTDEQQKEYDELIRLYQLASPEMRSAALAVLKASEFQTRREGDSAKE